MINTQALISLFLCIWLLSSCGRDKTSIVKFADKLRDHKVCSDSSYRKLLKDIDNNKPENPIEYLTYCSGARIINLKDYPNTPENYLEKIHRVSASIIPGLTFTDFKYKIVLDSLASDSSFKTYDVIVTLKANEKTYSHKSFISIDDIGKFKKMEFFGKIDQQGYYKIFNKILSDNQSPYRLHEVKAYKGNAVDWNRFGIIALTKDQADMLHGASVYFSPSYESFRNSLTTEQINRAIAAYQKSGLLSHLPPQQLTEAKTKVSQQENRTLNDVISCFPHVVYTFDTEMENLENPYEEILRKLSYISKGTYKPEDITDNFANPENKKAMFKFSVNGKLYSKELMVEGDWIDPTFLDLIKQSVADNKLAGQFYELYSGGQDAAIIFLTQEQADYLRENKLALFADQWELAEE